MSGPMGGGQGRKRVIGKGQRRMATRGFKLGSYVSISYRDPDRAHSMVPNIIYEGKIADKRVGHQDRESYVELKDCLVINEQGQVVAKGDRKRLMDAFIEECELAEPREDKTPIHLKPLEPEPVTQFNFAAGSASMDQMPMGQMVPVSSFMQSMHGMPTMVPIQMMQPMQAMPMHAMPVGADGQPMQMMMMPMMTGQQMQAMQMPMMMMPPSGARSRSRSR